MSTFAKYLTYMIVDDGNGYDKQRQEHRHKTLHDAIYAWLLNCNALPPERACCPHIAPCSLLRDLETGVDLAWSVADGIECYHDWEWFPQDARTPEEVWKAYKAHEAARRQEQGRLNEEARQRLEHVSLSAVRQKNASANK